MAHVYPMPKEPAQPEIADIQERVDEDPETRDAMNDLIHGLAYAHTIETENRVWEQFTDRIKYLISRAESSAIREQEHA